MIDIKCCGFSAADLDGTPAASIVEALLVIARKTTDAGDLSVMFRLPPAVAVAIVKAFESGDPIAFAKATQN